MLWGGVTEPETPGATEPYVEYTYVTDGESGTVEERTQIKTAKLHGFTVVPYYMFYCQDLMESVELPDDITKIDVSAFEDCSELTIATLPSKLTWIGDNAFYNARKLELNSLPEGVTYIGLNAFRDCTALKLNVLPAGIITIKNNAFNNCKSLTGITFEGTPQFLSYDAFTNCNNLTTINVPWAEGAVSGAPWGATNATINYNYTEPEA